MSVADSLRAIRKEIPQGVELVAVSKTKPEVDIMSAYDLGQRHFGENKVQDLGEKYTHLPKDIKWHFIGHLQTNKVKYIAPFVHLIHAVDSEKLLQTLQKEAVKNKRTIACLLQVKVAQEETKFGLSFEAAQGLLDKKDLYPNVNIAGLMAMASNTADAEQVINEFKQVKTFFDKMNPNDDAILSMGMSNDWPLAVEAGSNMIRVGSLIFGTRNYK